VPGARTGEPPGAGTLADLRLLAQGRLGRLLGAERAHWVTEITTTLVKRMGQAVLAVLEGHEPLTWLPGALLAVARDAAHAWLIAETELTRAQHAGMADAYDTSQVQMVAWVHLPGACGRCLEDAAASPLPVGHPWPQGSVPVHPHCRCIEVPVDVEPRRKDAP
jgi:hypothetical protein